MINHTLPRIHSLLADLTQASQRLTEALDLPLDPLTRDATLQRFEFTFELSWKLMQAIIQDQHQQPLGGVKTIIRQAAHINLIDNPETWFTYHTFRNALSHTYREPLAQEIYTQLPPFLPAVQSLLTQVHTLYSEK